MLPEEKNNIQRTQLIAGTVSLVFLLLAYLSHLGYIPLNSGHDEARRAVVSAEMMLSGDYITPTINGEIYLNKPPLYNWIIISYFKLFGNWSMFAFRLQVIIATLLTGAIIFLFTKKYTNRTIAFFTAFAFLTNGRLLIYDSFLGLIDTTFSLVIYLSFMLVWHYGEKKKYFHLFIITYILAALAFLMKGMPALAFQGITLLTYFIWRKKFKVLFHPSHFAGIAVFLFIMGSYYFAYFSKNDIAPAVVFSNLMNESSKRTIVQFGIIKTIIHTLSFPFEMVYHFAPWTVFIVAVFQKNIRKLIRQNDFIFYSLLVLITNILLYWTSPEVFARFLFMFLPLLYSILFYLFFTFLTENSWQVRLVKGIAYFSCVLLIIVFLALPFLNVVKNPDYIYLKCFSLAFVFLILLWVLIKYRSLYLYVFLLSIIFVRFGFNWFILEPRAKKFEEAEAICQQIVKLTEGKKLFILKNAKVGNFDGMSFHIATRRHEVLTIKDGSDTESFFIADKDQLKGKEYTSLLSFTNNNTDSLQLIKFNIEK